MSINKKLVKVFFKVPSKGWFMAVLDDLRAEISSSNSDLLSAGNKI